MLSALSDDERFDTGINNPCSPAMGSGGLVIERFKLPLAFRKLLFPEIQGLSADLEGVLCCHDAVSIPEGQDGCFALRFVGNHIPQA